MVSCFDNKPFKARNFQNYTAIYWIVALALLSSFGRILSVTAARHIREYLTFKELSSRALSDQLRLAASSAAYQPRYSCQTTGTGLDNRVMGILIPPLLIFLLSISKCDASVLNPQPVAIRGPFFQGWLMRTIDHINLRSFILIIGSFSAKGSKVYDEHYIFCGIEIMGKGTFQFESFPPPDTVTIEGSSPTLPSPFSFRKSELSKNTDITWAAKGIGQFKFNDEECSAEFELQGASIKFASKNRLAWSKSDPHSAGPEGWLGYTSLLPCHYFVHSVGSECNYSLELPCDDDILEEDICDNENDDVRNICSNDGNGYSDSDGDSDNESISGIRSRRTSGCRIDNTDNAAGSTRDDVDYIISSSWSNSSGSSNSNRTCNSGDYNISSDNISNIMDGKENKENISEEIDKIANDPNMNITKTVKYSGSGFTHIEGNHGSFFPSGWVWSQAIKESNTASFSLTGGKFEIGLFAPITFILFVRIGEITKIFRTTGLDKISYDVDGVSGHVKLTAYSLSKIDKIELIITTHHIEENSMEGNLRKEGSFGHPLYIPTADGFKNIPGCIETYTASANLTLYQFDRKISSYIETNKIQFPLTALEFGGTFQGIKLISKEHSSMS